MAITLSTISHPTNKLTTWGKTHNGSNIISDANANRLFPMEYKDFFKCLAQNIKECNGGNFVDIFRQTCDDFDRKIQKDIESCLVPIKRLQNGSKVKDIREHDQLVKNRNETIGRIVHKFRGNVCEIVIEFYIRDGGLAKYVNGDTYITVDPLHEEYVDGEAIAKEDGKSYIGIQIKNHKLDLDREPFGKAEQMHSRYHDRDHKSSILKDQIIISMSGVKDSRILDKESNYCVIFVGPEEISQYNVRLMNPEIWEEVADKI